MESGRSICGNWRTAYRDPDHHPQPNFITNTHAYAFVHTNQNKYSPTHSNALNRRNLMNQKAFQDYYPDHMAHCYGCGRLNEHHTAIPGYVYGGLLASLIDCHGTGTAAAAAYREAGRAMDSQPALRFLTGSLHVDYHKPTPMGVTLEIRGKVKEAKGRRVVIEEWIVANGVTTVRGEVVAVQVPEHLIEELLQG
jgi:acyl-coenzyme A thioesterase PaaI-like protein